jgi:hypothetical protein
MSSPAADSSVWPAVVNAALLGTDRTPLSLPSGGALGAACSALIDTSDAAATLLRVAAASTVYRRCGRSPGRTTESAPGAAPPDTRSLCRPPAAAMLRRIMSGEHPQLLGDWLVLASQCGVRAPSDSLRALLDAGRDDLALRSLVVDVGGTRAAWLAAFNEEWAYATGGASLDMLVTAWETSTGPARLAALRQIRQRDAERARTVLETSWTHESPTDRAAFIDTLGVGLSAADEAFLERALDDRRKEVRLAAAGLLSRLATSALVSRMTDRAARLVTLGRGGLLKRARVEVALPGAADAALVRDGVEAKPPANSGIGERAWWLAQIVAAVPPSTWSERFALEPAAVIRAADGDWRAPLVAGWLVATERHRDVAWATALWESDRAARVDAGWNAPSPEQVYTSVVPPAEVDAMLVKAINDQRDSLRGGHATYAAIVQWPHAWSDALARAVARRLKEYARQPGSLVTQIGLHALIERCAQAVPVSAGDAFMDGWPEQADAPPAWVQHVDTLTSVIRFRTDLHLAFES